MDYFSTLRTAEDKKDSTRNKNSHYLGEYDVSRLKNISNNEDEDGSESTSYGADVNGSEVNHNWNEYGNDEISPQVSAEELQEILSKNPETAGAFDMSGLFGPVRRRLPEEERRRRRIESNRLSAERSREKRKTLLKELESTFKIVSDENTRLMNAESRIRNDVEQLSKLIALSHNTQELYLKRSAELKPNQK
eukprot:CAMPEP_0182446146 /NCGR_PEP_ID=MMETSP1172-20130603/4017_1 /TAXON_ID=708627 /ORGANISM="Timspurckia oligopyrenoides, Strain CCMP3278" /LENGTH=192 /DNA_ID=CAMNT_0024642027 /DNA_START=239 /DNA_END=817 /DNA_ORIENTATION=+